MLDGPCGSTSQGGVDSGRRMRSARRLDSSVIAESERDARVGVPVPETLQFHRAAGIWRSGVPGERRRPSGSRID